MKLMKHSLLSLCALTFLSSPAYAVDLSDERAQELTNMLNDFVSTYQEMPVTKDVYEFEGDVSVTKKEGYFSANLPSLSYQAPNGGGYMHIGKISINAIPTDKENEWQMTVSLPTMMTAYNASQEPVATVGFDSQEFTGVFHKEFKNFSKLKANYKNLTLKAPKENITATLPDFSLSYNLDEKKEGFLSGPMKYLLTGLNVKENENTLLKAERLEISGDFEEFDMSMQRKMQESLKEMKVEKQQLGNETLEIVDPTQFISMLTDVYFKGSNSFSLNFKGNNIFASTPNTSSNTTTPKKSVTLNAVHLGVAMKDLRKEKASLNLSLGYNVPSTQMSQINEALSLVPNDTKININLNNIPVKELLEMRDDMIATTESMQKTKQNPTGAIQAQIMNKVPQMLTNSGTELEISDVSAQGDGYAAKITGKVLANASAVKMVTAGINAQLSGLSSLTTALSANPKTQQLAAPVSMLQAMGQKTGATDTYAYDLKLTELGSVTLNGADLSTMVNGLNPAGGQ